MKLDPGQLFEDSDHCFDAEKSLIFGYLLLSKDKEGNGEEYWKCAQFMNYKYGAQIRYFTDEEIMRLHYVGHILDLKNGKSN